MQTKLNYKNFLLLSFVNHNETSSSMKKVTCSSSNNSDSFDKISPEVKVLHLYIFFSLSH